MRHKRKKYRMTKRKKNRMTKRKKKKPKIVAGKWESCDKVPCGGVMIGCRPSYCHQLTKPQHPGSKNWTYCNMSEWGGKFMKYKKKCNELKEKKTLKKVKKAPILQVDALTMHNKMPYIWRWLKPSVRKKMIMLAKKPVEEINI